MSPSSPVHEPPPPAALHAAPAPSGRTLRIGLALVLAGGAALYAPVLVRLAAQWGSDANDSYGVLIPFFCAWLIWRRHAELRQLPIEPANAGLFGIVLALALLLAGRLGTELLLTRLSFLLMLPSCLLFLAGRRWLRTLAFPLGFLAFMAPLPTLVYNQLTLPMQGWASRLGVALVAWTNVPVLREGNVIVLPAAMLNVVAACSGIRSLLALVALATAYGYLTEPTLWRRWVLVAAMAPLAIGANAVRLGATILLTYRFGDAASHGFWHMLTGMEVFLVAVVGLVLLQRGLAHLHGGPRHAY